MNSVKLQDTKLIFRNILCSHTFNNELSEKEIKNTIPFKLYQKE